MKVNLSTRLIPLMCVHGNISRVFFMRNMSQNMDRVEWTG